MRHACGECCDGFGRGAAAEWTGTALPMLVVPTNPVAPCRRPPPPGTMLRIALARRARALRTVAPTAAAAKEGAPPPSDGSKLSPWGGSDDNDAPPQRDADVAADGAPMPEGMDNEAGGKPPKCTTQKARCMHRSPHVRLISVYLR